VHICPLFVLSLNLQDRFLDPIVSLERPAVHLAHAANRRALTQDNLAIFYARAATNLEGRAHSAKEYRTCKNGLAIPFHQFVKRRPAGAIKGSHFSVQDCIFHFKFPGDAGCQITGSPHFISAAGSEPVPAVANMCERPEAIVLLTHKPKQVAPAN